MDSLSWEQANRIIRSQISDDDTAENLSLRDESQEFLNSFYSSIRRNGEPLDGWRHFHPSREPESLYSVEYHRDSLRSSAAHYIEHLRGIHRREFDWLIVNVLMYAEISAYAAVLNPIGSMASSPEKRWLIALRWIWRALKWLIFVAILFAALAFNSSWLAGSAIALAVVVQGLKWRQRYRAAKTLQSMLTAYASVGSWTLSWAVVWELLSKSRNLGAYWDPEVYRLVELRMKSD
ncbi:hypothetical protein [Dokdonella immobilis]|uniref:Uncharacterized protein n=1 Tax=Dokdonella immobilis TaxID=578942 RepID=A0A1I4WMC6_9GAMM|nr:hypothetical protein [Dokdonella immobilis]SFN14918.1 hypothetical protein SAMN05216289_105175 [Dokdonella immobilis]